MANPVNFDAPKRAQRVSIVWTMETPSDDSSDRPDERDEGFWPSQDPDAAGYVLPENFAKAKNEAETRMADWRAGAWEYVGVVAVATIAIPIGQGSFVNHTMRSAGLWGVESDCGDYIRQTFEEEKAELLEQIKTLGGALASGDFDQSDA